MADEPVLEVFANLQAVPSEWDPLFTTDAGLQCGRTWFAATEEAALPAGAAPLHVAVRLDGQPSVLFPLLVQPAGRITSLTTPYTVSYRPLTLPGLPLEAMRRAGAAFGTWCRKWPTVVLEALDPDWPGLQPLCDGLQQAGVRVRRFQQFGNWRQAVAGASWDDYLAARPGQLRETIRRKGRAAARDGRVRFQVAQDPADVSQALDAYEAIYARSWKTAEPFPHFNAALLHRAAAIGAVRMGVMWSGAQAVAAQYWIVSGGVGMVLKLAHDDTCKPLSPGTLLTAHMIRHLLEHDRVNGLDFGRGDDEYKQLWTLERHQRLGLLIANPLRWHGALALLRQDLGTLRRDFSRR